MQPHDSHCSSADSSLPAQVEGVVAETRAGYARARGLVRAASGVRVLLALLHARASMTAQASHALRTLAVKCLVGLAHDPAMRHILSKLQVRLTSAAFSNVTFLSLPVLALQYGVSRIVTLQAS